MIIPVFVNSEKMTQDSEPDPRSNGKLFTPIVLILGAIVTLGPLFMRLPLTNDAVLYDLEARWLSEDLLPYRDIVEPNFPGVLVIHRFTRLFLGQSNEALRAVDFVIVVAMLLIGGSLIFAAAANRAVAAWGILFGLLFYLSQSEWCHCQRDTWLLLPTLLGLYFRYRQVKRCESSEATSRTIFLSSVCEGLIWGAGIWLKPHVIVMCGATWACSLFYLPQWKRKAIDSLGLLTGGVIAGGIGLLVLYRLGILSPFLASLNEWNPGYLAARFDNWTRVRYLSMVFRFAPWFLLHLVALPISLWVIFRFLFSKQERSPGTFTQSAVCMLYIFWMLQSHLLQHLFDYVHVPAIFLAILVLATQANQIAFLRSPVSLTTFGLLALLASPMVKPEKMALWVPALNSDLSPTQTDQLAQLHNPKWQDLQQVELFLREQNVQKQQVVMYNSDLVTLYWNLQLQSPTPYVYMYEIQAYFPDRKDALRQSMIDAHPKFIVTDLVSCGMRQDLAEQVDDFGPLAPPPAYKRANLNYYPWTEPVVFRAGRYMVHEARPSTDQQAEADSTPLKSEK